MNSEATGQADEDHTNPALWIWAFLSLFLLIQALFIFCVLNQHGLPCYHPWIPRKVLSFSFLPSCCRITVIQPPGIHHLPSCSMRQGNNREGKIKTEKVTTATVCITNSVMRKNLCNHTSALEDYAHLWKADWALWPSPHTTCTADFQQFLHEWRLPLLHSSICLQANDHTGKCELSGYLMTVSAWMCRYCSHKASQSLAQSHVSEKSAESNQKEWDN